MKSALKNFIILSVLILTTFCASAQKEINQYNPERLYEEGVLLFENQHYASALECFEQYIAAANDKNSSNVVMAKYYEATSSLLLGEGDGENKMTSFIKENPTSIMTNHAKFIYANHLFKNRKYRDALKIYSDINSNKLNKEEQDECDFKTAYCHYQTQKIYKAAPIFESLSKTTNKYKDDATYYYSHISYINEESDKALELFKSLKQNEKYADIADIYILQINFEKGNAHGKDHCIQLY